MDTHSGIQELANNSEIENLRNKSHAKISEFTVPKDRVQQWFSLFDIRWIRREVFEHKAKGHIFRPLPSAIAFVFAYANCWFSYAAAYFCLTKYFLFQ